MAKALLLIAIIITTSMGCVGQSYIGNEDSPYYLAPIGSRLTLHRALTIPSNQVAVFFQNGAEIPSKLVKHRYPYCKFEVYRIAQSPRSVEPDEFVITRVSQELVPDVDAGTLMYASAGGLRGSNKNGDGLRVQAFSTYMYLQSDRQPDVYRLGCGQWGYPPEDRHVTITEIRRALGSVITLYTAGRGE